MELRATKTHREHRKTLNKAIKLARLPPNNKKYKQNLHPLPGPNSQGDEIKKTIKNTNNNKASGPDTVPSESYKFLSSLSLNTLITLFQSIWDRILPGRMENLHNHTPFQKRWPPQYNKFFFLLRNSIRSHYTVCESKNMYAEKKKDMQQISTTNTLSHIPVIITLNMFIKK